MGNGSKLETDYLLVGAGALAMSFADTLVEHCDADVVIVDRRHRPGGHWNDSYPFVQLHQPSSNYGVSSTPLGQDRLEPEGPEAGLLERASGAEICGYFDEVMRHRLLATGRVRFFPMSDYLGEGRFRSLLTGETTEVTVRRSVVDGTYMASRVPATELPPFAVADGVQCVPVGALAKVGEPPAGFVIVGGGKTALDAIVWLLARGTAPDDITWIRPRDAWLLNRVFFQPGRGVVPTFEGAVLEIEAVAQTTSIEEAYERMEEHEVMLRTDRSITPTMMKGGTLSLAELAELRRVDDVVRLGHVRRIDLDEIVLDEGSIPTSPDHLHVHCAAAGLSDNPPKPVFTDDLITLQVITRGSLPLSAALVGFVEASGRTTDEKNLLCRPNPWPHTPFDWMRLILTGIRTELAWATTPDVQAWVDSSRLNLLRGLEADPDQAAVADLQGRFLTALGPAFAKIDEYAEQASPAEQARVVAPLST